MLNIPEEVKALFKIDGVRKNFRVHFVDSDLPDLTNKDIVTESVSFTESLCSRDKFKFGVCEAASISFEAVGIPNIKGQYIKCGLDIDCSDLADPRFFEVHDSGETIENIYEVIEFDAVAGETIHFDMDCKNIEDYNTRFWISFEEGDPIVFEYNLYEGIHEDYVVPDDRRVTSITVSIYGYTYGRTFIEYSYNIARQPTVEGLELREDLLYPSFHIPYGEFIVDSCKKDADTDKRSVMAYSGENVTDYGVPASINALYWYTNKNANTLNFTIDDVLDLTFPSYSVSRNEMFLGNYEIDQSKTYQISEYEIMYVEYMVAKMSEPNTKNIFTYIAKFDKEKHNEMIETAMQRIVRTIPDFPTDYFDDFIPKTLAIDNAYAVLTKDTRGNPTKLVGGNWYTQTLDWLNESSHNVFIDGRPHTLFKINDSITSGTTTTLSGVSLDPVYKNAPQFDDGGYIKIPARIVFEYRGSASQIESGNYVKYCRNEIGNGDAIFTLVPNEQLRNIYTYDYKTKSTVGSGYRVDYSYSGAIGKLSDSNWRNLVESCVELRGCLGHFNREGFFELKKMTTSAGIYPSETLFPSETLYPNDVDGLILNRALYSSAWFDDEPTKPLRKVVANYKGVGGIGHYFELPIPIKQNASQAVYNGNYEVQDEQYDKCYIYEFQGTIEECEAIRVEASVPIKSCVVKVYNPATTKTNEYVLNFEYPVDSFLIDLNSETGQNIVLNISNVTEFELTIDNKEKVNSIELRVYSIRASEYVVEENVASYDMSSNYFISNEGHPQDYIQKIMERIAPEIAGTQYTPSNIECIGQPYIEAGDWVTVVTERNGFDSLILSRTLRGIQSLKDSYESKGE